MQNGRYQQTSKFPADHITFIPWEASSQEAPSSMPDDPVKQTFKGHQNNPLIEVQI